MRKPIMIEGVPHRKRRGKLVVIPKEWLGRVTSRQTINARPSKKTGKQRRGDKGTNKKRTAAARADKER